MTSLPTGTVTFLFTDIEGSTRMWEQHPRAMQAALARHDTLVREAIEGNGGHVFKTVGDAFYAVFISAPSALNAALAAQRTLQSVQWENTSPIKVRMALHTGVAESRGGDYFGAPLNRVARLLSAGHGGQILLSMATQQLVHEQLPAGVELRDLGAGGLKNLARPEYIYQAVARDLPSDFPPIRTLGLDLVRDAETSTEDTEQAMTNPYKGLRAFHEADTRDFFGREALTARLLARLDEPAELARFLAVVGPSGSGKSSAVRAGLVPALRQGKLPGSERWLIVEMIPGPSPLDELGAVLSSIATTKGNSPQKKLGQTSVSEMLRERDGLVRVAEWVLPDDERTELVLVVDQFEEVFTLVEDEAVRVHFLNSLYTAVTSPESRVRVIITLRADFYDKPLLYPNPAALVQQRAEVVVPLAADELERAVVGPAERMSVKVEPELVAAITQDVGEQPGTLPLMEYALTELFERRQSNVMTLATYKASGGVLGALTRRADELYESLSSLERGEARQLFLRSITLGEGTEDTRRRVRLSELASASRDADALNRVIELFGKHRLLTFDRDPVTHGPTVEVAHEALIRTWGRMREWLSAAREQLRVHRQLLLASGEWAASRRDLSFIAGGARLVQFEALAQAGEEGRQDAVALTVEEKEYLRASLEERDKRESAEKVRQAQELALQKRAANRLRYLVGGLAIFLVVAAILTVWALNQSQQAQKSEATAQTNFTRSEAQRLAAEANALLLDPGKPSQLIALLAARSLNTLYTTQGDRALAGALSRQQPLVQFVGSPLLVWSVEFSPDGKYVLTAGFDSAARLWDMHTGQEVRQFKGHTDTINRVAFSLDGKYALTSSVDQTAKMWDVETGKEVRTFTGHTARVNGVAFSPDGKYVLTGSRDKTVRLWDAQTGQEIRQFIGHTATIGSVAFSPDGKYVLTSSGDRTAKLWDAQTGQDLRTFSDNADVHDVDISPDGKYVLTGTSDNTATLWDAQTGKEVRRFTGHTSTVEGVAFSPDGKYIATGSDDATAKLWEVETGNNLRTYAGHSSTVYDVAFSPDGKYIATGSLDTTVLLWDAQPLLYPLQFMSPTTLYGAIFSPDDRYILTINGDGTASLLDSLSGQELRTCEAHTSGISTVFSNDGKYILAIDSDSTAKLWDVVTGKEVRTYTFTGIAGPLLNAFFSPDGKYLMTWESPPGARMWDAQTGQELRQFGAVGASFSPDGKSVLTFGNGATEAKLLDISTGQELRTFVGHGVEVNYGVFSSDGKWIVATSGDKTAILWDAASGKEVHQFVGHSGPLYGAILSSDGKYVLTGSSDETVRLWNAATGQELRRFAISGFDSADFSHDGKWVITAADANGGGVVTLWQLDYQDAVRSLCTRLHWDLNDDERAQFEIKGDEPTCPKP
jgi:WD40 repeat protein/class 3 adenylate cyclase